MEADWVQAQQIREKVEKGMDPDDAYAEVMRPKTKTATTIPVTPKKNKFGAVRQEEDGHKFDSTKERNRYRELRAMELRGEIGSLMLQPVFLLHAPKAEGGYAVIGKYVADFGYTDLVNDKDVYEDVKGGNATKTPMYRWKKKHTEAEYGVTITEV